MDTYFFPDTSTTVMQQPTFVASNSMVSQQGHVQVVHVVEGDPEVVGSLFIFGDPLSLSKGHVQNGPLWVHLATLAFKVKHTLVDKNSNLLLYFLSSLPFPIIERHNGDWDHKSITWKSCD